MLQLRKTLNYQIYAIIQSCIKALYKLHFPLYNNNCQLHIRKDNFMSAFDKIVLLLNCQHKTATELMNYLNLSIQVFSDWKSGKNKSYMKRLDKIASFFDVNVNSLYSNQADISELDEKISTLSSALPVADKQKVIDYIELIIKANNKI